MADGATSKKKPRRVKGCYNCSQRRINCDRGTPCQKCIKKGLKCLGLGVRYRFNDGVASRGKLSGRSIPVPNTNDRNADSSGHSQTEDTASSDKPDTPDQKWNQILDDILSTELSPTTESFPGRQTQQMKAYEDPTYDLDPIGGQSRFLLSYFSENIAPAMVAINFIYNGYRDMILPISEEDPTVRVAIMAASASHLSLKHDSARWKCIARKYHTSAIEGLSRQANREGSGEQESTQRISLSTMVILLIEEMITVGSDFHLLLGMVRNFIKSQGGFNMVEKNPLGKFLIQQVRKMCLYALPFKPIDMATQNVQMIPREDLDFLYSSLDVHPEYSDIIFQLIDIIQKASQIYLARAGNAPDNVIADMVTDFFMKTAVFNAASPGGHILIWPFFIVGTECRSPVEQEFVESQLKTLWHYTGFGNTLYAIKILNQIWRNEFGEKPLLRVFERVEGFIM